jgi:hypothetical protein
MVALLYQLPVLFRGYCLIVILSTHTYRRKRQTDWRQTWRSRAQTDGCRPPSTQKKRHFIGAWRGVLTAHSAASDSHGTRVCVRSVLSIVSPNRHLVRQSLTNTPARTIQFPKKDPAHQNKGHWPAAPVSLRALGEASLSSPAVEKKYDFSPQA